MLAVIYSQIAQFVALTFRQKRQTDRYLKLFTRKSKNIIFILNQTRQMSLICLDFVPQIHQYQRSCKTYASCIPSRL